MGTFTSLPLLANHRPGQVVGEAPGWRLRGTPLLQRDQGLENRSFHVLTLWRSLLTATGPRSRDPVKSASPGLAQKSLSYPCPLGALKCHGSRMPLIIVLVSHPGKRGGFCSYSELSPILGQSAASRVGVTWSQLPGILSWQRRAFPSGPAPYDIGF